jgi:hypothetical protein
VNNGIYNERRQTMKTKRNLIEIALLGALAAFTVRSAVAVPSATDSNQAAIHRRAVEAVIWGMPAVNFERMLQAAIANGAAANQMLYWSRPVNWKDQTLTPNPDTIYFNPFYDTTKGPMVLEIPAVEGESSITGSIDDAWQCALEDVGPAGVDQGKGGKYLIIPPGYKETPPDGYIVVPSDTYQGFAILRSNFKSSSDVTAAVDYGKRMKIYPLGGSADQTVYLDVYDKVFDATIPYDVQFFESLNHFLQAEPWLTRDKVMIDFLKTAGIAKGKPFTTDLKTRPILEGAAREAHSSIDMAYERGFSSPFFEGTHWALPVSKETIEGLSTMFTDPDSYPIDGRAVYFSVAYFSAKHLGTGQFYLLTIEDKTGQPFDGKKTYRLHVPPNAPVRLYWSATAYDRKTHALIREASRSSRASNSEGVQQNADGSVDVFFGPSAPTGKEPNWVPTNGINFEILFRLYGPGKAFFQKTWTLPDLEEVK